ncbi:MAG: hypothetical protein RQ867_09050 [Mariprofundaceae bacterium]|nr:hypothetical protein [Mariprofundaceae bacterium]
MCRLPERTWAYKAVYAAKAHELAAYFHRNFDRFEVDVSEAVRNAGPVKV